MYTMRLNFLSFDVSWQRKNTVCIASHIVYFISRVTTMCYLLKMAKCHFLLGNRMCYIINWRWLNAAFYCAIYWKWLDANLIGKQNVLSAEGSKRSLSIRKQKISYLLKIEKCHFLLRNKMWYLLKMVKCHFLIGGKICYLLKMEKSTFYWERKCAINWRW